MAKANEPVQDAVKAYFELALGLTEASKKKAEKTVRRVARDVLGKSGATASQLQSMAEDVVSTGLANREAVVKLVQSELERALGKVGLVKAEEVNALTARIDELERQLATASGAARPAVSQAALAEASAASTPAAEKTVAKKTMAKKTVAKKTVGTKVTAPPAKVVPTKATSTKAAPSKATPTKTAAKKAPAGPAVTEPASAAADEPPAPVLTPGEQEIAAGSTSVTPPVFSDAGADDMPAAAKKAPAKKVARKAPAKNASRS